MGIYSVYAKIIKSGKRRGFKVMNLAVDTFTGEIVDYPDLKEKCLNAARRIYLEHDYQATSEISIERHLAGRYKHGMVSYRESRIRYRRLPIFKAKITYVVNTDSVAIEKAQFLSPETWDMRADYQCEAGHKWQIPVVTQKGFEKTLNNPATLWVDLNTQKAINYAQSPQNLYGDREHRHHEQGLYAGRVEGLYAGSGRETVEQEEQERETEV